MRTTVFSVAERHADDGRLVRPARRAGPQERVRREERAEQHDLGGEEQPDPELGVGESRVGADLGGVRDLHSATCSIRHTESARQGSDTRSALIVWPCCGRNPCRRARQRCTRRGPSRPAAPIEVAVLAGGVGADHSSVVASHGLSPARASGRDAPHQIDDEEDLEERERERRVRHRHVQRQHVPCACV